MVVDRRTPTEILGLSPIPEDGVVIMDQDSTRRPLGAPRETADSALERIAEQPVDPMEPRILGEPVGGEDSIGLGATRFQRQTIPFQIHDLRTHEQPLAIAGQDVGQSDGHVQALDSPLQIVACQRILVVEHLLAEQLTGDRVQPAEPQPAVQEHRTASHGRHHSVLYQDGPVYRPYGFELLERHHASVERSGKEPPDKRAVHCPQAIDRSIGRPEK